MILIVTLLDWNHNFGLLLRPFWCNWKSIINGSESHGHGESEKKNLQRGKLKGVKFEIEGGEGKGNDLLKKVEFEWLFVRCFF